jgi:glycosyltransferase involved in cell wall biosynthesis
MIKFHKKFNQAVKYFHGFSFITPFMEKYIMQNYNISQYKSVNWSSGVDIELFDPKKYKKKNIRSFRVFYHGGISLSRGNLNLIKAIEELRHKGLDIELVQVGIIVDIEIMNYVKNNKLEHWCKIMEPVPLKNVPQLIADSDLPVLPFPNFMAWRVSSPIKLMEYLAMGKKVLAPNMEAFTDVFNSIGDLVYYFDTNADDQVLEISRSIELIYNKQDIKPYYEDCVKFVSDYYTWERQAQRLFNFANELCSQ